jgi:hemoglobin
MQRSLSVALLLAGWFSQPALAQETLYQQLGGQAGVTSIVQHSFVLYLADDRIKGDLDNINLDRLKARLTEYLCHLTGGPCVYHGRAMKAAHAGLDLTQAKFNALAEDLQTAMEQVGIPYRTQNRMMALLAPMQRDIVTR